MQRNQSKSLPWRRFGSVILITIKFGELLLWISPTIINALRSYVVHVKECFMKYPNTLKLIKKKIRLRFFFSIHFSGFGYLIKHSSSCVIYYFNHVFRCCRFCQGFTHICCTHNWVFLCIIILILLKCQ